MTSEGRPEYQLGVSPAANSEEIWLATAAELVRASATRDEGSAVWRTWRTEALDGGLVYRSWGFRGGQFLQVLRLRALRKGSGGEGREGHSLELHGDCVLSTGRELTELID